MVIEDVRGLDVPVADVAVLQLQQRQQQLPEEVCDFVLVEGLPLLQPLLYVLLQVALALLHED